MLSLQPRYDLYRFVFPKTFLPDNVKEKYGEILQKEQAVIQDPIEYLNESVVELECLGIEDLLVTQKQTSRNTKISPSNVSTNKSLGKINMEPTHDISYSSYTNAPLEWLDRTLTIQLRMNQGFLNYWMLYETIFEKYEKPSQEQFEDICELHILNEKGEITLRLLFEKCYISSLDGLEFNFSKIQRESNTFSLNIKYCDIDVLFTPEDYDVFPEDETYSPRGEYLGSLD